MKFKKILESFWDRFAKRPQLSNSPDRVTEIVNEVRPLSFLERLVFAHAQMRASIAMRRKLQRRKLAAWRARPRSAPVARLKVVDTQTNHDRTRLYFELSNGQVVRADRSLSKKARRRGQWNNPLLADLVAKEIVANAARAA